MFTNMSMPKPIDAGLQISKAYLESIESGRKIQSKSVDNYLRLFFAREIAFARSGNSEAEPSVNPGGFIVAIAES